MERPGGSVNSLGRPRERERLSVNFARRKATCGGISVLLGTDCGGNLKGIIGFRTKGKTDKRGAQSLEMILIDILFDIVIHVEKKDTETR